MPPPIQMLEGEMLPFWDSRIAPNGNYIMNGVEFDFIGRRAAYHSLPSIPATARSRSAASLWSKSECPPPKCSTFSASHAPVSPGRSVSDARAGQAVFPRPLRRRRA